MEIKEFIDGLKRDKARGNLAPHQIILLIAMFNLYVLKNTFKYDIIDLNEEFKKTWLEHQNKFESKNNKIGLPFKAFVNKEYINIEVSSTINDFRNNNELDSKVMSIEVSRILQEILKKDNVKNYLISRITI